ncbi:hypothetical protein AB4865_10160 [Capnocytophaga sp. ARDL2]|uniref:hypothetical protein n=1 Tax=Capnocytophaga sp. ARDL2 TaxID=3238809 RepID=UPI003559126F
MKTILITFLASLFFIKCERKSKTNESSESSNDTLLVKHEIEIDTTKNYYQKKQTDYFWILAQDTMGLQLNVNKSYGTTNNIWIGIHHEKPLNFTYVIKKINEAIPMILEDFDLNEMSAIYFKTPMYYPDLSWEIYEKYQPYFGEKEIRQHQLTDFLKTTTIDNQLNSLLTPFNKKVFSYSIEKLHKSKKENFQNYVEDYDLSEYPDFVFYGGGLYVQFKEK